MAERDINYKLITEIKKRPCLYDYQLPAYSNKSVIDKTWSEIAKEVKVSGKRNIVFDLSF